MPSTCGCLEVAVVVAGLEGVESERWFQGGIAFGAFFVCVLCAQLTLQTWHQTGSFFACGQIKAVFDGGFWLY